MPNGCAASKASQFEASSDCKETLKLQWDFSHILYWKCPFLHHKCKQLYCYGFIPLLNLACKQIDLWLIYIISQLIHNYTMHNIMHSIMHNYIIHNYIEHNYTAVWLKTCLVPSRSSSIRASRVCKPSLALRTHAQLSRVTLQEPEKKRLWRRQWLNQNK